MPQVIQHRHQRGKEDDRRQHLEREEEFAKVRPEYEFRSHVDKTQHRLKGLADLFEYARPGGVFSTSSAKEL